MRSGWQIRALGDVVISHDARRVPVKEADRRAGPYPYYGASGIVDYVNDYIFEGLHLLVAEDGENLRTRKTPIAFLANGKFWVNNHAHILTGNHLSNTRFLSYALSIADVASYLSGSTMPKLTQGNMLRIPILLPRISEQERIVDILSALDDKIELNRRMNERLEASARALFRDWFVDFGPTRAKAEGLSAYLAPDLWSLFPNRLGDDGVPEGWTAGTLEDVSDLNSETWSVRVHPERVRYVDLANTKWGYVEAVEAYDWQDAPSRARRILRPGDTIVGTVRPGNGSFAFIGEEGLTGSTGFAVLRPKRESDQALVWCIATSGENIDRLAHLADGGAYPAVRPDIVQRSGAVIAPVQIRDVFGKLASAYLDRIESNKVEFRALTTTRDALLPKLMSGEVRVLDAEALAA